MADDTRCTVSKAGAVALAAALAITGTARAQKPPRLLRLRRPSGGCLSKARWPRSS